MAYDIGINFRATSGYVTDGADETYSLGESYPTTRSNANGQSATFGYDSILTSKSRDRTTSLDRRQAGIVFQSNSESIAFRIDLPEAGDAVIHMSAGDTSTNHSAFDFYDGATNLVSRSRTASFGDYLDASNVVRTSSADWVANEVGYAHTFANSYFLVKPPVGGSGLSAANVIGHIRIVRTGAGGGINLDNVDSRAASTSDAPALTTTRDLSNVDSVSASASSSDAMLVTLALTSSDSQSGSTSGTDGLAGTFALVNADSVSASLSESSDVTPVGTNRLLTGLNGHWPMEGASGATEFDLVGSADLSDAAGTVGSVAGKIGNARSFVAATGSHRLDSSDSVFDLTSSFTFAVWFKLDGYGSLGSSQSIFAKDAGTAGNRSYGLQITESIRYPVFYVVNSSGTLTSVTATAGPVIVTGTWYLAVCRYNAPTGRISIQINDSTEQFADHSGVATSAATFKVGIRNLTQLQRWNGPLDLLSLWDRVLDADDATDLWNSGNGLAFAAYAGGVAFELGNADSRTSSTSSVDAASCEFAIGAVGSVSASLSDSPTMTGTIGLLGAGSVSGTLSGSESVSTIIDIANADSQSPSTSDAADVTLIGSGSLIMQTYYQLLS